ncbi:hypothetical protein BC938DRAFT_470741 [Jimgerdemannia flammicorona]|uniref:Uncharacterized protein n=1 Tax=Jimgerdemannia flammicorona TaxID=994334 RepID=A0A433QV56_9FUNG|nr:hypothetical protein BC938DRAFT_470741 [Jimgerdemannia flammicorona]
MVHDYAVDPLIVLRFFVPVEFLLLVDPSSNSKAFSTNYTKIHPQGYRLIIADEPDDQLGQEKSAAAIRGRASADGAMQVRGTGFTSTT